MYSVNIFAVVIFTTDWILSSSSMDCQMGRNRPECLKICDLNCNTVCDPFSRRCMSGCRPGFDGEFCEQECLSGWYGSGCLRACSVSCVNRTCDAVNGRCIHGCRVGYRGAQCAMCPISRFGPGCELSCSANCRQHVCHYLTGFCTSGCANGYTGPMCNQRYFPGGSSYIGPPPPISTCPRGTYGDRCSRRCSVNCGGQENLCDPYVGRCIEGCDPGFFGERCHQICPNGRYGNRCKMTCSEHCAGDQNVCHYVTGVCDLGCDTGYTGSLCLQGLSQNQEENTWAIAGGVIAAVVVVAAAAAAIVAVLVWRKGNAYRDQDIASQGRIHSNLNESQSQEVMPRYSSPHQRYDTTTSMNTTPADQEDMHVYATTVEGYENPALAKRDSGMYELPSDGPLRENSLHEDLPNTRGSSNALDYSAANGGYYISLDGEIV